MEQGNLISPFAKPKLTGLFVGTMATITFLIYGLSYRSASGLSIAGFHISPLLFLASLVLLSAGILVAMFKDLFRLGNLIYIITIIILTVFCLSKITGIEKLEGNKISVQLRTLLSAMIIILGCSFLIIPLFFNPGKMNEERDPRYSR